MNEEKFNELRKNALMLIMSSMSVISFMDNLEGTIFYQKKIKFHLKGACNEIIKQGHLKDVKAFNNDAPSELILSLDEAIENFFKNLANMELTEMLDFMNSIKNKDLAPN